MSESSVKMLCLLAGIAAVVAVWPLLAAMSVRPAGVLLLVTGLLAGVLVSRSSAGGFGSLMRFWLGALIGGLGQWGIHALQFPDDPYSFGFNFTLALAIVVVVALTVSLTYLLVLLVNFAVRKLRAA